MTLMFSGSNLRRVKDWEHHVSADAGPAPELFPIRQ